MKRTLLASALAFTALGSAQAAQAQQACVAPEDAADAVVYVMPAAYDATLNSCKSEFNEETFLTSAEGSNFIEQFRTQQDERWAGTFRFLKVFIEAQSDGDEGMSEMIAAMPEESLRPFVDGILGQMIGEQIKTDTCGTIDRGVELLSPLPVENVGGLVAFILELVELDNPPICGLDGTIQVIPEGPLSE
ncbi:MAG: hypothetical protein AAFZ11_09785 [Pseudomonadota bacterium]